MKVRAVRLEDRGRVYDICRRTWDGWDYVPLFFDQWVTQPGFWVAEVRGRIAGFGKATELTPGEWWLEGLRVDRRLRGAGIGTKLSFEILERTLACRPLSLRLVTASVNTESIQIIGRMGFRLSHRAGFLTGKPCGWSADARVVPVRLLEAQDYLAQSQEFAVGHGLLPYTWLFYRADRRHLAGLVRNGFVIGHRQGGALDGLMVLRPDRYYPKNLFISYIGGSDRALVALGSHVHRIVGERGSERVSGMGASRAVVRALGRVGLEPHPVVGKVLVYEYPV